MTIALIALCGALAAGYPFAMFLVLRYLATEHRREAADRTVESDKAITERLEILRYAEAERREILEAARLERDRLAQRVQAPDLASQASHAEEIARMIGLSGGADVGEDPDAGAEEEWEKDPASDPGLDADLMAALS